MSRLPEKIIDRGSPFPGLQEVRVPTKRDEIVAFCNDALDLHELHDYGPMGLQFTGAEEVTTIATAVSISYDVILQAVEAGAQMILVHHGLWWNNESRILDKRTLGRIELLKAFNISCLGYHLCLDAHMGIGHNSKLAHTILGEERVNLNEIGRTFADIGASVNLPEPISIETLTQRVAEYTEADSTDDWIIYPYGPEEIKRVACITGGAPSYLTQAHQEGYDAFVTGEAAEFTYYQAKELGMHFIAAGHHATEKSGVKTLGRVLAIYFGIEHVFIDAPNPV